jgi:hypothetical protein
MPCPSTVHVFPEGYIENIWKYNFGIVLSISTLAAMFVILTHLYLPSRRTPHGYLIASLNIGVCIYTIGAFLAFPDPRTTLCASSLERSNMENNLKCLLQGILITFGVNAAILFMSAIIINLHLNVVWRSQILERKHSIVQAFVWILAGVFTAIPVIFKQIESTPVSLSPNSIY